METKFSTKQLHNNHMKRTGSSNSDNQSQLDSPLRFHSPLRSDMGDPNESPPYSSPAGSPEKPPSDNSKAIVTVDKFTQFSPIPSPYPSRQPPNTATTTTTAAAAKSPLGFNRTVREEGTQARTKNVRLSSGRDSGTLKIAALGFRLSEIVLCVISFSVMASDKTQGWSGDSYDRYKEYRYCLAVNIIGFVYSVYQAFDLGLHLSEENHWIPDHLHRRIEFFMDQAIAYLLISAASAAATRVDDWISNWGSDEFTKRATVSIAMAFLAFLSFLVSSLISGYKLCTHDSW